MRYESTGKSDLQYIRERIIPCRKLNKLWEIHSTNKEGIVLWRRNSDTLLNDPMSAVKEVR